MALTLSMLNRNFIYDPFRGPRRGLARREHVPASALAHRSRFTKAAIGGSA
jgi:hypothetical protein